MYANCSANELTQVPLDRYMGGGGGLRKLREELEAENTDVRVPAEVRWLSGAKARAHFHREECGSSSVVAAVLSEEVFGRLCKRGVRLPGGRHEVDAFEEERPDALCLRCGEWGHITPHCEAKNPKCAICAKDHATKDHRCSVEGCRVGRGRMCPHTTAKCANCGGPHGARADAYAAKRIAQHAARGWRSPPPPGREKRREAPEAAAPDADGEGEPEVEGDAEAEVEGMEE